MLVLRAVEHPAVKATRPSARRFENRVTATFDRNDEEVKQIVANALDQARRILRGNRDILERVTGYPLDKDVMEADELRAMFAALRAVNL